MKNLVRSRFYITLFTFAMLVFMVSGFSQNLLVQNAGITSVNGYYLLNGSINGVNRYIQDVAPISNPHQIYYDGVHYWVLTPVLNPFNVLYRGASIFDGVPPETGWESTGKSNDTPPTVGSTPLPVELSSFSASLLNSAVKLSWRTETEVNNFGFEIQKAVNPASTIKSWELTGFVEGGGNSNSPKNYSFNDADISGANLIYYRLKQIDNDGSYSYSPEVEVDLTSPDNYSLGQNYPNPFNPSTKINYKIARNEHVNLSVYNVLGKEIAVLVNELQSPGSYAIVFSADDLPDGVYFYKLETPSFTKTSKMILMK